MKKASALILICLLTLNIVSSLKLSALSKNLASGTIHSNLSFLLLEVRQQTLTTQSLTDVLKFLEKMIGQLQSAQKNHETISIEMKDRCVKEEEFRNQEVIEAEEAKNNAEDSFNKCDISLKASQKDLPELKESLELYISQLNEATEQRNKEHEMFLQRKSEFEEAISFLEEFSKMISEGKVKDLAFTPREGLVKKSESLVRHASKFGLLKEAVPILLSLSSIEQELTSQPEDKLPVVEEIIYPGEQQPKTQQPKQQQPKTQQPKTQQPKQQQPKQQQPKQHEGDDILKHNDYSTASTESRVDTLNHAIKTLIDILQQDLMKAQEGENELTSKFQIFKNKLDSYIEKLTAAVKRTEEQIREMTLCVESEVTILKSAMDKARRNEELKGSTSNMCESFAQEFILATNNRMDEVKIVQEIIEIIKFRMGNLPSRFEAFVSGALQEWATYKASPKFQKFVDYVKQHVEGKKQAQHQDLQH